jgi:hypothetical protein
MVIAAGALLAAPALVLAGGGAVQLKTSMSGDQVVPMGSGAPNGRGKGEFKVRVNKRKLCYELSWRKTKGAVRGYIFKGAKGANSPNANHSTVVLFGQPQPTPASGCVTGVAKEKLEKIADSPRKYHVSLINGTYPEGAVRGQLKFQQN